MDYLAPEKPGWLTVRPPRTAYYSYVKGVLKELGLNTVCASARCPNAAECWDRGHCTFMILGDTCTRSCRFCGVNHAAKGDDIDESEPDRLATAADALGLDYVSITSVDRDDLPDFGALQYANCIAEVKKRNPQSAVEVLIPDFGGDVDLLERVIAASPDVITHNVETVERLSPLVRDRRAGYYRSLDVLRNVKRSEPRIITKSSLLLGMGEELDEVKEAIYHLHEARVDVLTVGQYLRPGQKQLPVKRYVRPEEFDRIAEYARSLGFEYVLSGPMVRSSYLAAGYLPAFVGRQRRGDSGRPVFL